MIMIYLGMAESGHPRQESGANLPTCPFNFQASFHLTLLPTMAPLVHAAKITLSCPLFSADFDPRDNDRLLVGGGGGEGRSGVGNKIVSRAAQKSILAHGTNW